MTLKLSSMWRRRLPKRLVEEKALAFVVVINVANPAILLSRGKEAKSAALVA